MTNVYPGSWKHNTSGMISQRELIPFIGEEGGRQRGRLVMAPELKKKLKSEVAGSSSALTTKLELFLGRPLFNSWATL